MVRTVSEIVSHLIKAHESGQDLNISKYVLFICQLRSYYGWAEVQIYRIFLSYVNNFTSYTILGA